VGTTSAFSSAAALFAASLLVAPQPRADPREEIQTRLEEWVEHFNAGRAEAVCDLFSHELIAQFRGQPERGYDEVCDLLHRSMADPASNYRYELDLHEVLIEGDLAVARLTWTLFVSPANVTSIEPGIDVFRRELDGQWRIIRYLAYAED
jgi:ketosteroid isomerase-like protein